MVHTMEDRETIRGNSVLRRRSKIGCWVVLLGSMTVAVAATKSPVIIGCAAAGSFVGDVSAFLCLRGEKDASASIGERTIV